MKTLQHTLQLGGAQVRQAALVFGLLAVGLVLSLATFARGSQLQLSLWNKGDFTVEICGERYYANGQLTLRDLPPGQQRVRVMQRRNNHNNRDNHNRLWTTTAKHNVCFLTAALRPRFSRTPIPRHLRAFA